jgi:hypothetical protein
MPQLDKKQAKEVQEVEPTEFPVLPIGFYWAKLLDCKVSDAPGGSGFHYWIWEFGDLSNVETKETAPGRQWMNTSLSPNAQWKLAEVFEAFGVSPDTDTDELLGTEIGLFIGQREIEQGQRKGQIGNQVERVVSLDEISEGAEA